MTALFSTQTNPASLPFTLDAKTDVALELSKLGAIGDQQTLALIANNADIVHLSWPNLDDPTVFAPLLNSDGSNFAGFRFEPEPQTVSQHHEKGTNVLVTTFGFADGCVTVTDIMSVSSAEGSGPTGTTIRMIESEGADVSLFLHAAPHGNYETPETSFQRLSNRAIGCVLVDRPVFVIEATFDLFADDDKIAGQVKMQAGDCAVVTLGNRLGSSTIADEQVTFQQTRNLVDAAQSEIVKARQFWTDEIGNLDCDGCYSGTIERSMLTLAMLHMRRHGTLAAAGTFGYPEAIGGKRNWDYRYAWVRDSAIVAEVAARAGMVDEALGWVRSVLLKNGSCDRSPLRLMLALDGSGVDEETVLKSWPGYLNSPPVRNGNEASGQLQLDIFGELVMALLVLAKCGADIDGEMLDRTTELIDWLVDNWQRPDSSIWELRGPEKHYLFSRLMSWVAFRDGAALLEHFGRDVPPNWKGAKDALARDIEDNFWCPDCNCYMQTDKLPNADAAMIYMRVVGYLEKGNERWEASKTYLRQELVKHEGVLRFPHDADDGFDKNEGTFVLCTTWWIEALWMDGQREEAKDRLERLLARVGTTGIMAEEIAEDGSQLGNLPQAFSHAGLISAALRLQG